MFETLAMMFISDLLLGEQALAIPKNEKLRL